MGENYIKGDQLRHNEKRAVARPWDAVAMQWEANSSQAQVSSNYLVYGVLTYSRTYSHTYSLTFLHAQERATISPEEAPDVKLTAVSWQCHSSHCWPLIELGLGQAQLLS